MRAKIALALCMTLSLGAPAAASVEPAANPASTAPAAASSTPAARETYSSEDTVIGTLLDDPAARAILDKHIPGMTSNPQIEMARSFTLRQIQQFAADQVTDEILAKIDAEFKALSAK